MFNVGSSEIVFIAVVALLILGPKRLPEMARNIGKLMREFRARTDEVRSVVEREFYRLDDDMAKDPKALPKAAPYAVSQDHPDWVAEHDHDGAHDEHDPDVAFDASKSPELDEMRSQVTAGMPADQGPAEAAPASTATPAAEPPLPAEPSADAPTAPAAEAAPQKS